MKEYDFTTLAGFKEAAESIAKKAKEKELSAFLELFVTIWGEVKVEASLYNEDFYRVWRYEKAGSTIVLATPENIAEAAAALDARVDGYEGYRIEACKKQVEEAEQELAKAKARLAQAQEE